MPTYLKRAASQLQPYYNAARTIARAGQVVVNRYKHRRILQPVSQRPKKDAIASTIVPPRDQYKRLYARKRLTKSGRRRVHKRAKARRRLRSLLRPYQPHNTLIEISSAPQIVEWVGDTWQNQIVAGGHQNYGCWLPFGATTNEHPFLRQALDDIQTRVGGFDITSSGDNIILKVTHKTHRMAIRNVSGTNGVTFDLYTFVAKQDISDALYKDPKTTWITVAGNAEDIGSALFTNANGLTPLGTARFGHFWKLMQKERVTLDSFAHKQVSMICRKGVDWGKQQPSYAIKGKTMYWLIVLHPYAVDNGWLANQDILNITFCRTTHYKPLVRTGFYAQESTVASGYLSLPTPGINA